MQEWWHLNYVRFDENHSKFCRLINVDFDSYFWVDTKLQKI